MILTYLEIEKEAKKLLDAGHITKNQYEDRIENAKSVMEFIKESHDRRP